MTVVLLVAIASAVLRRCENVVAVKSVHEAIGRGAVGEALAMLRWNPALIYSVDDLQQTPLHIASHRGHVDVAKWLIAHGARVNATAYSGFTPLHLTERADIARALINAGADLDKRDNWGNTALQFAAETQKQAVADVILASGCKVDLITAIMLAKRELVKRMIHDDPSIARRPTHGASLWGSKSPLGLAAGKGDLEIVQLLLDAGADVNEGTYMPNAGGKATALTMAVWAGNGEIVGLLLDHGAKIDVVGGKFYPSIRDYARAHSSPRIIALLEEARRRTNR
jgi:ankyrin repeat protein